MLLEGCRWVRSCPKPSVYRTIDVWSCVAVAQCSTNIWMFLEGCRWVRTCPKPSVYRIIGAWSYVAGLMLHRDLDASGRLSLSVIVFKTLRKLYNRRLELGWCLSTGHGSACFGMAVAGCVHAQNLAYTVQSVCLEMRCWLIAQRRSGCFWKFVAGCAHAQNLAYTVQSALGATLLWQLWTGIWMLLESCRLVRTCPKSNVYRTIGAWS